ASFALTFILTASDYVTPNLVGGLGGQMVGQMIQQQFVSTGNYPLGAALAVVSVGAIVLCLVLAVLLARLVARGVGRLMVRLSDAGHGASAHTRRRIPVSALAIVTWLAMVF